MRTLLLTLTTGLFVLPAHAKYSGGSGTAQDPYQIATAADLIALGEAPTDYDQHFILTADIDLDPKLPGRKVFDRAVIAPDTDSVESGFQGTPFSGVFDGNARTISHLTITGKDYLGLFGQLAFGGQVRQLGIRDVSISGSGETVGGLVGDNAGSVTQCRTTGAIGCLWAAGGLVGVNHGSVAQCYSMAAVNGYGNFGGLVGSSTSHGTVAQCYSTGTVTGWGGGGLGAGGESERSATDCFWDTQTSGVSGSAAGGAGKTTAEMHCATTFVCWADNGVWTIDEGEDYPRLWWENRPGEPLTATELFGGGVGTEADPYLIYRSEQLNVIGHPDREWQDRHFKLMADADLAGKTWSGPVIPVFAGSFDGNGHTISHLTIRGKSVLGLFGHLWSRGEVKNLDVVGVNVTGSSDYVGGLVGYNHGSVTQCCSTGVVSGNSAIGGLVGYNAGSVTRSYTAAAVRGDGQRPWSIGGLVGSNYGAVTNCHSTGTVSGNGYVGGLVGENNVGLGEIDGWLGAVAHCYSTGVVKGNWSVGGLIGGALGGGEYTAGLVTECFWDAQTSDQTKSAGGTAKTTAEMWMVGTFLDAGWDFVDETHNGTSEIWRMPEGGGYPVLLSSGEHAPVQLQGLGKPEAPYLIFNALDLGAIVHYSPSAHYRLAASIDLSGISWGTAVIPWFGGSFDGNGHLISLLTIRGGGYLGLFGHLASGGEVKNLSVVDADVAGSGGGIAGVVGKSDGTVTRCYSSGAASGGLYVGGLVGANYGRVVQCHSAGEVGGGMAIGGLVGSNGHRMEGDGFSEGKTVDCYSTAEVEGIDYVGGLVGSNSDSVTRCYSAAVVNGTIFVGGLVGGNYRSAPGTVTASFWDMETLGQAKSTGGTGKTTAQMQTAKTFLDAGWDFVGEAKNGTADIWWILEGKDYPRFVWERGQALLSYPQDGAVDVSQPVILRWRPGGPDLQHDVYFGETRDLVGIATRQTPGIYRARQPAEATTYDLGVLGWGKTYYWRIDEVNEADPDSPWTGGVWSFATADSVTVGIVDDFEIYTNDDAGGKTIFQTWIDGLGYREPMFVKGNGTGSMVGHDIWRAGSLYANVAETGLVHGGMQSMPMYYDDVNSPHFSEAQRTWATPQDWTVGGADTLTLYFLGDPNNSAEPLYVAVEDSSGRVAVAVHPDADAALATEWQKWHVALGEAQAAGADVAAVKKMVIGIGDRKNPRPGGTGRIYIDDIRLTKRMP
jgi:hypothetical protein